MKRKAAPHYSPYSCDAWGGVGCAIYYTTAALIGGLSLTWQGFAGLEKAASNADLVTRMLALYVFDFA